MIHVQKKELKRQKNERGKIKKEYKSYLLWGYMENVQTPKKKVCDRKSHLLHFLLLFLLFSIKTLFDGVINSQTRILL